MSYWGAFNTFRQNMGDFLLRGTGFTPGDLWLGFNYRGQDEDEEPDNAEYARVKLTDGTLVARGSDWLDAYNPTKVVFATPLSEWGEPEYYQIWDAATGGNLLIYFSSGGISQQTNCNPHICDKAWVKFYCYGSPEDGDTLTIDGITYTFDTVLTDEPYHVIIHDGTYDVGHNLRRAMADSGGAGTVYGTGTVAHPTCRVQDRGTYNVDTLYQLFFSNAYSDLDYFTITAAEASDEGNDIEVSVTGNHLVLEPQNGKMQGGGAPLSFPPSALTVAPVFLHGNFGVSAYAAYLICRKLFDKASVTAPTGHKVHLYSTPPTDRDLNGVEISDPGYSAQSVTFGAPTGAGLYSNTNQVQFTFTNGQPFRSYSAAIRDGSGNLLFVDNVVTSGTINAGETLTFPIGNIKVDF